MIRTFIQVAGIAFTIEAALFLAKAGFGLSAETIAQMASAKWDHNADVVRSLAQQRADTWIGCIFLIGAFVLSLTHTLWPMRWVDFAVHKGAAAFAVGLAVLLGFGAYHLSGELARMNVEAVNHILEPTTEESET